MMIRMPRDTFQGVLPPLTGEQRTLEEELRSYVRDLADTIGERNLFHPKQLVAAADYTRVALGHSGYQVKRHQYHVSGHVCENLDVEIPG